MTLGLNRCHAMEQEECRQANAKAWEIEEVYGQSQSYQCSPSSSIWTGVKCRRKRINAEQKDRLYISLDLSGRFDILFIGQSKGFMFVIFIRSLGLLQTGVRPRFNRVQLCFLFLYFIILIVIVLNFKCMIDLIKSKWFRYYEANFSRLTYNKNRTHQLIMNLQAQRLQTIRLIIQKDPNRYGYLTTQPFASQIASNYQLYSNDFLLFLLKNIQEFNQYHTDVILDDPTYAITFRQFLYDYQNCYQCLYQMQIQMQNYQAMQPGFAQQPQYQPVQSINEPREDGRKCHGRNKHRHHGHGHHEGESHHRERHHGERHRQHHEHHEHEHRGKLNWHEHHGRRRHGHGQKMLDDNNQLKHQSEWHKGHKGHHRRHRDRKERQNSSSSSSQSSNSRQQKRHENQKNDSYKKQDHQMVKKKSSQSKKLSNQQPKSVQSVVLSRKPMQETQKKSTKYSLKQIRQFIHQWNEKNRNKVSKDLIQQVNEINSHEKRQIQFQERNDSQDQFGNKPKQLTQEQKYKLNEKHVAELLQVLPKEGLDVGYEKLVKILEENVGLFDLTAVSVVRIGFQKPQYAFEYAIFARRISELHEKVFKGSNQAQKQYKNTFRVRLTSETQQRFQKQLYDRVKFKNQTDKTNYVDDSKRKLLNIVSWIAMVIRKGVIKKKVARVCIQGLVHECLKKYYSYRKRPIVQDSNYQVYFQMIIEFILRLGTGFQTLKKPQQKNLQYQVFDSLYSKITTIIDMRQNPSHVQLSQFNTLNTNDIFTMLQVINQKVIRKSHPYISHKLVQLRQWRQKKYTRAAKANQQSFSFVQYQKTLKTSVANTFTQAQKPENALKTIQSIVDIISTYSQYEYMSQFLSQIQHSQKQQIDARIKLLKRILSMNPTYSNVKSAWWSVLEDMAQCYEPTEGNLELLSKTLVEIAVAYHEPKEYLRPKTNDEDINALYDKILASRTRK